MADQSSYFQMAPSSQGEYQADLKKFRRRMNSSQSKGCTDTTVQAKKKIKQSDPIQEEAEPSSADPNSFPEISVEEFSKLLLPELPKISCKDEDANSSIVIDFQNGFVPLWEIGSTINWTVLSNFPSEKHRKYVEAKMVQAIKAWDLSPALNFKYVADMNASTFVVTYSFISGDTLAEAFFPNEHQNHIIVYGSVFRSWDYLRNLHLVLEHELGHVIGLRHEFAPEKEGDAIVFGPRDSKSVMTYNWPMTVQERDRTWTRLLYNNKNATHIGEYEIKRYEPYTL